jgi:hypothetical protein
VREREKISQIFLEWADGWQGRNELRRVMEMLRESTVLYEIQGSVRCLLWLQHRGQFCRPRGEG